MKGHTELALMVTVGVLVVALGVYVCGIFLPPVHHGVRVSEAKTAAFAHTIATNVYMAETLPRDRLESAYALLRQRVSEWGDNSTNEAFYDWIVKGPHWPDSEPGPQISGDTDGDGRKEFHDDWGNPFAIIRGDIGIGTTYRLSDGRRFRLVNVVDSGAIVCTWAVGSKVLEITYNKRFVATGVADDPRRLLILSIVGDGQTDPGRVMLAVRER